jgi:hypothetical protein
MGGVETVQKVKAVNARVETVMNNVEGGLKDLISRLETGGIIRPIERGLMSLLPIAFLSEVFNLPLTPWVFAILVSILVSTSNQTELTLAVLGVTMLQLYASTIIDRYCGGGDARGLVECGNAGLAWFGMIGVCGWMVLFHLKMGGRKWWGWGKPY